MTRTGDGLEEEIPRSGCSRAEKRIKEDSAALLDALLRFALRYPHSINGNHILRSYRGERDKW